MFYKFLKIPTSVLRIFASFTLLFVYGCEAPLNLEGVSNEKGKAIYRFDEFQAAGKTNDTTIVVGSYGAVIISNDHGTSWQRKELDGKPSLIDLAVCPDESFVALDFKGHIWLSHDDGENWESKEIGVTEVPQALTCDYKGKIWVVGSYSTIHSSEDYGKQWKHTSFDEDVMFTSIQFINDQEGVITGEFGTFMHTSDAGRSWGRGESIPNEFYPQAAYFSNLNTGWVVGLNGKIFHTNNRGQSWQEEVTDSDAPLYGITIQDHRLFVVGERGIVLYRDNFNQWNRYDYKFLVQSYLRVALPVNQNDLLLAGGAGAIRLIRTSDVSKLVALLK